MISVIGHEEVSMTSFSQYYILNFLSKFRWFGHLPSKVHQTIISEGSLMVLTF